MKKKLKPVWKIHTPKLLQEIVNNSGQGIYKIPLRELGKLLFEVGEAAARLNDPVLNALMMRLTIYSVADPSSKDHDPKLVRKTLAAQGWH